MLSRLLPYLLVGAGGFLGANARFVLGRWTGATFGTTLPVGTFIANIAGSFLLGLIATLVTGRLAPNGDRITLAVSIGFIGAFTTFSTFEFESNRLLQNGAWLLASANIVISVALGLVAVRLGILAARYWAA